MKSRIMLLAVLGIAFVTTGCSTIFKQGYHTAKGASGEFYELETVSPSQLSQFKSFEFTRFTNDLGDRVPLGAIAQINARIPRQIEKELVFYPDGKPLRIEGKIIHYVGSTGIAGAAESLIGDADSCVCRVKFIDPSTENVIGEAICWGTVKSALRRGAGELGNGVGKGIAEWMEKRLPKAELEARKKQNDEE